MSATTVIRATPLSPSPRGLRARVAQAADLLKRARRVVVVSHQRPDGDAIGSTLAAVLTLRSVGIEAYGYNQDGVPEGLRFLPQSGLVHRELDGDHDTVLLLDCSTPARAGDAVPERLWDAQLICLDHHSPQGPCDSACVVRDTEAPATGELVYRLMVALEANLNDEIATCLFCALQSDTGSFRYASTTRRAMALGERLLRTGIDVWSISSSLYEEQPEARVRLLAEALLSLRRSECGRLAWMQISLEMLARCGATRAMCDGIVNHARSIKGVEIAAIAIEEGDRNWRINFRSRGNLDVSRVARRHGGGGHRNAAACTLEVQAEEVASKLLDALDAAFQHDS